MIEVELHDRSDKLVKVLTGAKHAVMYPMLNQDGAATFKIHRSDQDAIDLKILSGGINRFIVHLLRKGDFESAFTERFVFVVESWDLGIGEGEEEAAWHQIGGRGTLSLLEGRGCWPPGYDGATQASITNHLGQIYIATNGGAIMAGEIDRSNPRFALQLTHSVNTSTVQQDAKLRFDDLRKVHDYLVANGPMEAQMVGLDYQAADRIGTDKSASVKVSLGPQDSLLDVALQSDTRALTNFVVAQGTGEGINAKLAVSSDAASIAAYGRREGFLAARNIDTQSELNLAAAGAVAQLKDPDLRITIKFSDSAHTQLFRDISMGDTVTLAVALLGFSAPYRVVGIQIADTDDEYEEVHLDLNSMRLEYLLKLAKGATLTADGLRVLNIQPQGSPYNDSFGFPDSADGTYPWRVKRFIPSNLLKLNYTKLSFSLGAFRSPVAGASTVTSGASSAASSSAGSVHNHTTPNHSHVLFSTTGALGLNAANPYITTGGQKVSLVVETPAVGTISTDTSGGGGTAGNEGSHTHLIPHTHNVTPLLTYGIFEGTVATNAKVLINGVDRTVALGGPAGGFTTDQAELEVAQWLNIGAWNTFEVQPSNLGRIYADIRMTGYIQST